MSLSNSVSDSELQNNNRVLWLKNLEYEAHNLWNLGKELGVTYVGSEADMIAQLVGMEKRDNAGWQGSAAQGATGEAAGLS